MSKRRHDVQRGLNIRPREWLKRAYVQKTSPRERTARKTSECRKQGNAKDEASKLPRYEDERENRRLAPRGHPVLLYNFPGTRPRICARIQASSAISSSFTNGLVRLCPRAALHKDRYLLWLLEYFNCTMRMMLKKVRRWAEGSRTILRIWGPLTDNSD